MICAADLLSACMDSASAIAASVSQAFSDATSIFAAAVETSKKYNIAKYVTIPAFPKSQHLWSDWTIKMILNLQIAAPRSDSFAQRIVCRAFDNDDKQLTSNGYMKEFYEDATPEQIGWLYQLNAIFVNSLMNSTPQMPAEFATKLEHLNKRMLTQKAQPKKRRQITCIEILWLFAHYYDVNHPMEMRIAWAEYEKLTWLGDTVAQMTRCSKHLHDLFQRIGEKQLQAHMQETTEPTLFWCLGQSEHFKISLAQYTANRAMNRSNIDISFLMTELDRTIHVEKSKKDENEQWARVNKALYNTGAGKGYTPIAGVKGKGKSKKGGAGKSKSRQRSGERQGNEQQGRKENNWCWFHACSVHGKNTPIGDGIYSCSKGQNCHKLQASVARAIPL